MSPIICRCRQLIIVLFVLTGVQTGPAFAEPTDTVYQCIPSGFTIGIPAIQVFSDLTDLFDDTQEYEYYSSGPVNRMQDKMAQTLSNSGLFRDVLVFPDASYPDSTDLYLLVSISTLNQLTSDAYPEYEMEVDFLLVENLDGEVVWSKKYATRYAAVIARVPPSAADKFKDAYVGFLEILGPLVGDLEQALNQESGLTSSWEQQRKAKTVTHSQLEPLWVVPIITNGAKSGLTNYARFIEQKLRQRLVRKNCFAFSEFSPTTKSCLTKAVEQSKGDPAKGLSKCADLLNEDGLVLMYMLTDEGENLGIHAVLLQMPQMNILYDKMWSTSTGWRLAATLEKIAAGVAQASHTIPHQGH